MHALSTGNSEELKQRQKKSAIRLLLYNVGDFVLKFSGVFVLKWRKVYAWNLEVSYKAASMQYFVMFH